MKIPKTLKIGGHQIRVRLTPDIDDSGQADRDKNEILLRINLSRSQLESTLIHEIFHHLNSSLEDTHHGLLDGLAEQFYQVLSDNKMLR
jgi:hypothetical protein